MAQKEMAAERERHVTNAVPITAIAIATIAVAVSNILEIKNQHKS